MYTLPEYIGGGMNDVHRLGPVEFCSIDLLDDKLLNLTRGPLKRVDCCLLGGNDKVDKCLLDLLLRQFTVYREKNIIKTNVSKGKQSYERENIFTEPVADKKSLLRNNGVNSVEVVLKQNPVAGRVLLCDGKYSAVNLVV